MGKGGEGGKDFRRLTLRAALGADNAQVLL
jgi:hypothetical protein